MNVADLIGLVALLTKTVDALRYTAAKNVNGAITQLIAWAIGIGGTFAVAQTQWASHISVGSGGTLARQGALSLVAIGLAISSGGGVLNDLRSAIDNTNSAVIPPLVGKYVGVASGVLGTASTTGLPKALQELDSRGLTLLGSLVSHIKAGGTTTKATITQAPPPPPAPEGGTPVIPALGPAAPPPPPPPAT